MKSFLHRLFLGTGTRPRRVLESGARVLANEECHLVVETHRADLERDCVKYLGGLGYRTAVIPNGWYRRFVPEQRPTAHNRWLVAHKGHAGSR